MAEALDVEPLSFVYFAEDGAGRVKIGVSTNVAQRVRGIGIPGVRLLGVIEGGRERERDVHALFAAKALGREWFTLDGELRGFIDTHAEPFDHESGRLGQRSKVTLRLEEGLAERVREAAARAGLCVNAWLFTVVLAAVEKGEAEGQGRTVRREPVRRLVKGGGE